MTAGHPVVLKCHWRHYLRKRGCTYFVFFFCLIYGIAGMIVGNFGKEKPHEKVP